ncbi:hypothetical protein E2C01_020469 [Portunus trituberculatus]|uniref:Uncharacterized protein n=1 Tax=Portunus trituberculatus TaxID=210409 RepID=A0A5B7DZY6_PORTR|nr:hypothetical protein [Portunus trituberculatus]
MPLTCLFDHIVKENVPRIIHHARFNLPTFLNGHTSCCRSYLGALPVTPAPRDHLESQTSCQYS